MSTLDVEGLGSSSTDFFVVAEAVVDFFLLVGDISEGSSSGSTARDFLEPIGGSFGVLPALDVEVFAGFVVLEEEPEPEFFALAFAWAVESVDFRPIVGAGSAN